MGVVTRVPAAAGLELPSLLPGGLLADPTDDGRPARRTPRDWFIDATMFVLASLVAFATSFEAGTRHSLPDWVRPVDIGLGAAACLALWLRRRYPAGLALAMVPVACISLTSAAAAMIALFTVAIHRRVTISAPIAALHCATALVFFAWRPDRDLPYWVVVAFAVLFTLATFAWGMFVRARRQLVLSLRERAVRAESEQQLRVAQARQLERTRIAREMHDVLAHRISLLSLHAGALEFRADVPAEEVAKAAGVIRTSAHQALQDLREVIGVLRDEERAGGGEPTRPQPTLADVQALVEESRSAGVRVHVTIGVDDLDGVPTAVGRNAYRIIQEGLTNARKHAHGVAVDVTVEGAAGKGLTIRVRNPAPVGGLGVPIIPGAGTGIVGLAERAELAGGRLESGRTPTGDFELRAWLPWPATPEVA